MAAAAAVAAGVVTGPSRAEAVTGQLATAGGLRLEHRVSGGSFASLLGDYANSTANDRVSLATRPIAAAPAMAAAPTLAARPATTNRPRRRVNPDRETSRDQSSPAPAQQQNTSPPPASPSATPPQSGPAAQPYVFYDSVTPGAIPAGPIVATYATGSYAVPASAVAGRHTIWIDTWATDPAASVLDVEPGDATPAMAATWVAQRLTSDHSPDAIARLYTIQGEWQAVQEAVATLPSWMLSHIRWWIADPTGVPHMVPGASATQWYWGPSYDISTANPDF